MCPCAPYRGIFPGAVADDSVAPRVPVSPLGDIVHLALYHQPLVRPQVVLLDLLPGVEGDLRLALPRLLAFLPPFPHLPAASLSSGRAGGTWPRCPRSLSLSCSPALSLSFRSCPPFSLSLGSGAGSEVPPRLIFPALMYFHLAHSPAPWEARPIPPPAPAPPAPPASCCIQYR